MQLHPFYATVSRPIFWDREGGLYETCDCPSCLGTGQQAETSIDPSVRDRWVPCEQCNGAGYAMMEVSEDDLINSQKEAA